MVWLWVLVSLTGLMVVLLSVPVDLALSFERDDRFRGRIRIAWLFGLVGKNFGGAGEPPGKPKKPKAQKPRKASRGRSPARLVAMFSNRPALGPFLTLGRRLLQSIRVRDLSLYGRLGLPDPADTGILFSVVTPVAAYANSLPLARVNLEPDFTGEALYLQGRAEVRVVPLRLAPPFLLCPVPHRPTVPVDNVEAAPPMTEIRADTPFTTGGVVLTPLVKVHPGGGTFKGSVWHYSSKEAVGVVVDSPEGSYALDLEGRRMPADWRPL